MAGQSWRRAGWRFSIHSLLLAVVLLVHGFCPLQSLGQSPLQPPGWRAGADLVFLQPRFNADVGLIRTEEDVASNVSITQLNFDRNFTAAPRVWFAYETVAAVGLQASWWQLSSSAEGISQQPPANGFGELAHPAINGVDLASVVPAERLSAASSLDLYAIDLEVTKRASLSGWDLLLTAGIRHAAVDRFDQLELRNQLGDLAGLAGLSQQVSGLGPTIRLATERQVFDQFSWGTNLRTSLLLASRERRLAAAEDLDLLTPFTTRFLTEQDGFLPIVSAGVSLSWRGQGPLSDGLAITAGLESEWWSGVGTLSDEHADMSLLGLSCGISYAW